MQFNFSLLDMVCGETYDQNCQNEFENAKRNNDLDNFYKRCRTEGGAKPMRKTCSLCCNQGNVLILKTKNSVTRCITRKPQN